MSVVTAIEPQKDGKRVNVFLDNKFGFGIDLDNLVLLKIKIGTEVSPQDLEKILGEAEYKKTLEKFLNFLMIRMRSEKECRDWFLRKKIKNDVIQKKLIDSGYKLSLLDDYKFAKWWVESRIQFKPKGKSFLKIELRRKGVSNEIIERVLEQTEIDELGMAREIARKKLTRLERYQNNEKSKKLMGFLVRRGFSLNVTRSVIDELILKD